MRKQRGMCGVKLLYRMQAADVLGWHRQPNLPEFSVPFVSCSSNIFQNGLPIPCVCRSVCYGGNTGCSHLVRRSRFCPDESYEPRPSLGLHIELWNWGQCSILDYNGGVFCSVTFSGAQISSSDGDGKRELEGNEKSKYFSTLYNWLGLETKLLPAPINHSWHRYFPSLQLEQQSSCRILYHWILH